MLAIVVALLAAFAGVVLVGPVYIGLLQRLGYGKQIRSEGPEGHLGKAGTPTMGGMLLVVVVMFLAMAMRIEECFLERMALRTSSSMPTTSVAGTMLRRDCAPP